MRHLAMSQIAGAVMMTLLLVVLGATFGGIELARGGLDARLAARRVFLRGERRSASGYSLGLFTHPAGIADDLLELRAVF